MCIAIPQQDANISRRTVIARAGIYDRQIGLAVCIKNLPSRPRKV